MMDPEMMKYAEEMMKKMTPEQMAAMQRQAAAMDPAQMQQAMNMFQNLTPQQRQSMAQAASNVSPDTFTQQASTAQTQFSAREKYEIDASERLKTEGNRLHGLKEFDQASEKYQQAISNLSAHTSSSAATLRISCMGNLASCYLQLRKWDDCIQQCNNVLGFDASNRKALYRRGQALTAVGRADEAVRDLQKAVELSPESEKPMIKEKLEEALQKQHHAARGIVIEEAGDEKDTTAEIPQGEQHEDIQSKESNVESEEDDDERPPLVDEEPTRLRLAPEARASSFTAPTTPAAASQMTSGEQQPEGSANLAAHLAGAGDPNVMKHAAERMAGMSDAELAHVLAASGRDLPPGANPEMVRQAAEMMKSMPADQLHQIALQATQARGSQGTMAGIAANAPQQAASNSMPAASTAPAFSPPLALGGLLADPEAIKNAVKMMESMSPEQLESLASTMPDAPQGMKIDAAQMKMAAKMMENMTPEDLQRMSEMARSMGMAPPPGMPRGNASSASTQTSSSGIVAPETFPPGGASSVGGGGGASSMAQPGAMPQSLSAFRTQMADPAMLKSMQSMLKGMDPAALASMMSGATGRPVSTEQAQKMVDQMGGMSEKQLEWIARLTKTVNFIIDVYQRARAWARSNAALAIAILILLVALLLRWLGWM